MNNKPQTTYAGKNPFGGPLTKPQHVIDPSELAIANDPPPSKRYTQRKLDPIFAKLKPGQCLKCPSGVASNVGTQLRKFVKRRGLPGRVLVTSHYEADGMGRVWLLPAEEHTA